MKDLGEFNLQFFGGDAASGDAAGDKKNEDKKFSQADIDKMKLRVEREIAAKYKDYDDLKNKADKLDQMESGSKTDLEKALKRAEEAEAKLSVLEKKMKGLEIESLKRDSLEKAGLPTNLWKRVIGDTQEEIDEDIKELAKTFTTTSGDKDSDKGKPADQKPHGGVSVNPGEPGAKETEAEKGIRKFNERHGAKKVEGVFIPKGW